MSGYSIQLNISFIGSQRNRHNVRIHGGYVVYEGHPISSDNDPKPISLGPVSIIFTCYLEYRELNHLFK